MKEFERARNYFQIALSAAAQSSDDYGISQTGYYEIGTAIKALDKQRPKHIEEQTEDDRQFIDYVCPNCKTTLQQKMKGATRTTIYKYKYCHYCGQCLDWNDHPTEKGGGE